MQATPLNTHFEESHRRHSPTEGQTDNLTPITPSNTPQSPTSGRESPQDLQATMDRIRVLRLDSVNGERSLNETEDTLQQRSSGSFLQVNRGNVFHYRHRDVD